MDTESRRSHLRLFGARPEPCPSGIQPHCPRWLDKSTIVPCEWWITSPMNEWCPTRPLPLVEILVISLDDVANDSYGVDLSHFPSLCTLEIFGALLEAFASNLEAIFGLRHLRSLTLTSNEDMSALPDTLGDLAQLQDLHKSYTTKLAALPASLGRLPALEHLSLGIAPCMGALPESIGD